MNMVKKVEENVFSYMEQYHMVSEKEKLLLGVSGGADSVCLLFLMSKLAKERDLSLAVVHVHHGLRETADRDEAFVKELCQTLEVPFYAIHRQVTELAKADKLSLEEAGRKARYEAFESIRQEIGATKIALAHNSNDRAETMLFHLFRGTGIRGLSGIKPCRGVFIRPLLCVTREEIEGYLQEKGISYCQDETNDTDEYTRNRIRHHILPFARKEISPRSVEHMFQTGERLELAQDYLDVQVGTLWQQVVEPKERGLLIQKNVLLSTHPFLQRELLLRAITSLSPGKKDIAAKHVEDTLALFSMEAGKQVDLPFGIQAKALYDQVLLVQGEERIVWESQSLLPEFLTQGVTYGTYTFQGRIFPYEKDMEFPVNQYTKWFDYDKIKSLVVRSRETGDALTIRGKDGDLLHKKVKDYLITEKIPKDDRDYIPLLMDGAETVWMVGYRVGEHYKLSDQTKMVLEITVIPNKES